MAIVEAIATAAVTQLAFKAMAIVDPSSSYSRAGGEPYERLVWVRQPSAREAKAAFPTSAKTWDYGAIMCKGLKASGHLTGCSVDRDKGTRLYDTSVRALPLLRNLAVSRGDAKRLMPHLRSIIVRFQVQYAGITDQGGCWNFDFCSRSITVTPRP
jgi:hypothetical protein